MIEKINGHTVQSEWANKGLTALRQHFSDGKNHYVQIDTPIEVTLNAAKYKSVATKLASHCRTLIEQNKDLAKSNKFLKNYAIGLTVIVGVTTVSLVGYKYVFSKEARDKRTAKRILKKVEKLNEQESN